MMMNLSRGRPVLSRHSSVVRAEMKSLSLKTARLPMIRLGLALLAAAGTASTIASLSHL